MSNTCSVCNHPASRILECPICGDDVCLSCYEQCNVCGQWVCHRHIICVYKKVHLCTDCYANQLRDTD